MVTLRINFLGTSSAVPTAERGLTSIAISRGAELILFDAGEGMQRNFIKAGLGMNREMKIFVTHLHADHCMGLLGLMQTMSLQGRTRELHVYGQPRLRQFILENIKLINFGLGYDLKIHTIDKEGIVAQYDDYLVSCCNAKHSIPALSFCLQEFERPGIFNLKKARSLDIPEGELYGKLQRGNDISYNGKIIRSDEVVGPRRRGRKICFSGDTRPTAKLVEFFNHCDLLIHESTYDRKNQEKAIEYSHSTASDAAEVAGKAHAKRLYLTHFSARYDETAELVREAKRIHHNVHAAKDLMEITVPYPD